MHDNSELRRVIDNHGGLQSRSDRANNLGPNRITMSTAPKIIFIVVCTIAMMAITYVGTMAYMVITNGIPDPDVLSMFKDAGIYVLGALTGILVNTRSAPPSEQPSTEVKQTIERMEKITSDPEPKEEQK